MLVQMIVQRGHKDVHVWVLLLHALHALGRTDDAHELDVLHAVGLQEVDGGGGGSAGGQHRVDHDHVALGDVGGHLEVVLHGQLGLGVAEQADVADLDVGHHADHAVHHAQTGAEDGNDGKLLAGDAAALGDGHRRLHVDLFQRQVAGRLIAHQHGDFGDKLAEFLHAGLFIAQDGQLVLDQRVIEYDNFAHVSVSFYSNVMGQRFCSAARRSCRSRSACDSRRYTGSSSSPEIGGLSCAAIATPQASCQRRLSGAMRKGMP